MSLFSLHSVIISTAAAASGALQGMSAVGTGNTTNKCGEAQVGQRKQCGRCGAVPIRVSSRRVDLGEWKTTGGRGGWPRRRGALPRCHQMPNGRATAKNGGGWVRAGGLGGIQARHCGTVQARAGLGQVEGMHWHEGEVVMKEHARRKGCSLARWREGAAGRGAPAGQIIRAEAGRRRGGQPARQPASLTPPGGRIFRRWENGKLGWGGSRSLVRGWMDGSMAGRGGGSGRAGQVWRRLKRSAQAAAGRPLTADTPSGAGVRPRQMLQLRAAVHAVGLLLLGCSQPHHGLCRLWSRRSASNVLVNQLAQLLRLGARHHGHLAQGMSRQQERGGQALSRRHRSQPGAALSGRQRIVQAGTACAGGSTSCRQAAVWPPSFLGSLAPRRLTCSPRL